jgi:hypothetical protein
MSETDPVGVPDPDCGATVALMLTGWPCLIPVGERLVSVVVLGVKLVVLHWFTRFAAFTDPKPLAMS